MKSYKQFALSVAKEAAKIITRDFKFGMVKENKEDGSPVTKSDLAINRLVIEKVKKQYPTHSILAEEESDSTGEGEFVWVCDPVDGTIPFSHGMTFCTFSLALVQNGRPILGVVVDPFRKNYFFAEIGQGAYLNNVPIKVSQRDTLRSSVVFCEYWQQAAYDTMPLIKALEAQDCNVPVLKSLAYGCSLIAAGEVVGTVAPAGYPWDLAASKIIIEEAGGKVTDFYGNDQRYDRDLQGCILSNGFVHQILLDLVAKTILNK